MNFLRLAILLACLVEPVWAGELRTSNSTVYILPIREDIMPPLVYLVRRGVKEAMAAHASLLLIDMDTNGGRVDVTEEIIAILNQFKGETATYVNRKAFSAGAFIAVATQKIFMAPQSVIGAAAPIMLQPTGGAAEIPPSWEAKMTSGISGLVRATAQKNGHNTEVVEAMIDKSKELTIDGEVLNEKGKILTLTNTEAEREFGNPPKPLLSLGTLDSTDDVLKRLGYAGAQRIELHSTGAEKLASWLNLISPILLIIGVIGIYIEVKTPGVMLPGIVGAAAFALYFIGGYVAGLSGLEWIAVFIVGLGLVLLEIFVLPGHMLPGVAGAILMGAALVMAMVDVYPGMPSLPSPAQLKWPMLNLIIGMAGALMLASFLSRYLPQSFLFRRLVSQSASGVASVSEQHLEQASEIGEVGTAISTLRPGGKAKFGEKLLDVISQGDLIAQGEPVKIIGHSGHEAIVERAV